MAWLRRRPVPDAVKAVRLPPGERRTSWAVTPTGEPVVATDTAVLLPSGVRLDWPQIAKATWTPPRLTLVEVAEVDGAGAKHVVELTDDSELPAVVRNRVTASVAWSSHSKLAPAGGVRVVGRTFPGADALQWQLVYDTDTDAGDPLIRAQAEQLLNGARRSLG